MKQEIYTYSYFQCQLSEEESSSCYPLAVIFDSLDDIFDSIKVNGFKTCYVYRRDDMNKKLVPYYTVEEQLLPQD